MQWTRAELKERAKFSVRSFYWYSVLVALILAFIGGDLGRRSHDNAEISYTGNDVADALGDIFIGPLGLFFGLAMITIFIMVVAGIVLSIFVFQPLEVGCKKYFLEASEGRSWLGNMSYAFKNGYANVVASMLLMNVFIFLWGLLLIIPGIYKSYEYRMIPYLLAEDSHLSFSEAKRLSSEMMYGEKWDTFVLDLSFILWNFLSALTWGLVGIFWVNPYIQYTNVELYKVLRTKVPGPYYTGNNEW